VVCCRFLGAALSTVDQQSYQGKYHHHQQQDVAQRLSELPASVVWGCCFEALPAVAAAGTAWHLRPGSELFLQ
jgi:hypothetical protein